MLFSELFEVVVISELLPFWQDIEMAISVFVVIIKSFFYFIHISNLASLLSTQHGYYHFIVVYQILCSALSEKA